MKKLLFLALLLGAITSQADDKKYMNVVSTDGTKTVLLSKVQKITFNSGNAVVAVVDADAVEAPLSTLAKITFTDEAPTLKGDVNGDGVVDIADVNTILTVMFSEENYTEAADVDGDGVVDIADVNAVLTIMFED